MFSELRRLETTSERKKLVEQPYIYHIDYKSFRKSVRKKQFTFLTPGKYLNPERLIYANEVEPEERNAEGSAASHQSVVLTGGRKRHHEKKYRQQKLRQLKGEMSSPCLVYRR